MQFEIYSFVKLLYLLRILPGFAVTLSIKSSQQSCVRSVVLLGYLLVTQVPARHLGAFSPLKYLLATKVPARHLGAYSPLKYLLATQVPARCSGTCSPKIRMSFSTSTPCNAPYDIGNVGLPENSAKYTFYLYSYIEY